MSISLMATFWWDCMSLAIQTVPDALVYGKEKTGIKKKLTAIHFSFNQKPSKYQFLEKLDES
jgi:hypothetical protein